MPPAPNNSTPERLTVEKSVSKAAKGKITSKPVNEINMLTLSASVAFEFLPTKTMATPDTAAESNANGIPIIALKSVVLSIKTQSPPDNRVHLALAKMALERPLRILESPF
jgi:hypothetical protein